MSRIAGIVGDQAEVRTVGKLGAMVMAMARDASFESGQCQFHVAKTRAGWVSSFGSGSDCSPVWNEERSVCLLFAGEEFTLPGSLGPVQADGQQAHREVARGLVHSYEKLGANVFRQLNGWFSGLIVDRRHKTATLFIDRYGLSRIYYHEGPEGFYFASEAKALLKVLPDLRQLDLRSLGEWFSCGCTLQNRTLFRTYLCFRAARHGRSRRMAT